MKEFILLMAFLMALVALSIDAMLPALGTMAHDLGVTHPNNIQFVIGALFFGLMFGQLFYGPLADAIGRKPALYSGLALFCVGSLISWHADSLALMLVGRTIQGIGVGAPRIITIAIVRDRYHGRDMARIMSLVMGIFILVPAIAPTVGQFIIHWSGWRSIFLFYLVAAAIALVWAHFRLQETLAPGMRRPFNFTAIWAGLVESARTRVTLGYTICSGLAFGTLIGYLNSTQQIFQEIFHTGDRFAIYFGILALAIGAAFFSNSALVRRYGMRIITSRSLIALIAASFIYLVCVLAFPPNLLTFMIFACVAFFFLGLTFGNMSAMGLEPMGHMAGLASAFMGAVSSAISLVLGTIVGQLYNGTLLPITIGFLILATASYVVMCWTERTALPHPTQ